MYRQYDQWNCFYDTTSEYAQVTFSQIAESIRIELDKSICTAIYFVHKSQQKFSIDVDTI